MKTIELKVDDDLWAWLQETAAREELSIEEVIEVLIGLKSNLRRYTSDGRNYSIKAEIYRGSGRLVAPRYPSRAQEETTN